MHGVCPSWLSFVLYNPLRKFLTDRERIMAESAITSDSVVLEVGAGNGFLTEALAARARKVIAVELQEGMVKKLRKRVSRFGDRVDIILGDIASVTLGDASADVCLLYYCFHEVADKAHAVEQISRFVKEGGSLSVYEPGIEVSKADMVNTVGMFEHAGFVLEHERDNRFTRFARLRKS